MSKENRSEVITIRFTPSAKVEIESKAEREGLSAAQWVRKEILSILQKEDNKNDK